MEHEILYEERDGLLYPVVDLPEDLPLGQVGKYGLLWLNYMKENHKERYRLLWRLGRLNRVACEVHEEAWEMLDEIMNKYLAKHLPEDSSSTMEMWRLREEAKRIGEEVVLKDIVYRSR